jgi:PAS domain S-box-containing protein
MASGAPASIERHDTAAVAAARLQAAFERIRNPMLIVDDQRWCVTANAPACGLLGIEPEEVPWRRIDDFTPVEDRNTLDEQWEAFLANGAIEGWYHMLLPTGRTLPVEFSATANVLPGRHLSVVMPRPGTSPDAHGNARMGHSQMAMVRREAGWTRIASRDEKRLPLTGREREVLALVAGGLKGGEIAQRLFLSPETVKSHVQNAMTRLGAHTRAHAVAIALTTGQIDALTAGQESAGSATAATLASAPRFRLPRAGALS